jgi:3-oxoacyl-[acyl-carrier protein] reductase
METRSSADFGGKVVLVTGGARGIGRGIVTAFAEAGAAVVLADYLAEQGRDAAREIAAATGAKVHPIAVDVRDAASAAQMVAETRATFGRIDVLVNNAAIYPNTPVLEMDESEWDAVFDTNVKGLFLVSKAVGQVMVDQGEGGRIVNISSGAGVSGRIGSSHYCSSKAALNMFTRVLAIELAPHGITVNAVAPGLIEVERTGELAPEYVDAILRALPVGRIGTPADIANAVLFLAAPAASFVTGSILSVDGGSTAGRTGLPLSRRST